MVSVGVSALEHTDLHYVDAGVEINGQQYCEVLLMLKLLSDIKEFWDYFTFQLFSIFKLPRLLETSGSCVSRN